MALAFIIHSGLNVYPIVGAQNEKEMLDNLGALDIQLSQDDIDYLDLKK